MTITSPFFTKSRIAIAARMSPGEQSAVTAGPHSVISGSSGLMRKSRQPRPLNASVTNPVGAPRNARITAGVGR